MPTLSKNTYKLLKHLYKTKEHIEDSTTGEAKELISNKFVDFIPYTFMDSFAYHYVINTTGEGYVQSHRKRTVFTWLGIIIAFLSAAIPIAITLLSNK